MNSESPRKLSFIVLSMRTYDSIEIFKKREVSENV